MGQNFRFYKEKDPTNLVNMPDSNFLVYKVFFKQC